MGAWDAAVEQRAVRLVQAVCAPGRPPAERDRSWHDLLVLLTPHLEPWIERATVLRRVGLAGADDVRTVLVDVIERLHDRDCRNLRDFLGSEPVSADELDELALIGELSSVAGSSDPEATPGPDTSGTPFRAWLLTLCRFVAKDHVKRRLGWTSVARVQLIVNHEPEPRSELAAALAKLPGVIEARWREPGVVVLYRPGTVSAEAIGEVATDRGWTLVDSGRPLVSKRDLYSGADRLDGTVEPAERPPITDLVTAREVVAEVRAYMATLPSDMQRALELWMADASFEEIAATIDVGVTSARALVRAGQARLRERFRPAAPVLFGGMP